MIPIFHRDCIETTEIETEIEIEIETQIEIEDEDEDEDEMKQTNPRWLSDPDFSSGLYRNHRNKTDQSNCPKYPYDD